MNRIFPILLLLLVSACRTEPTASPDETASDPSAEGFEAPVALPPARRVDGAGTTTRTLTLDSAMSADGQCFVSGEENGESTLLLGELAVCDQADGLEGQSVVLTLEDSEQEIPMADGTQTETIPLVVRIEPAQ